MAWTKKTGTLPDKIKTLIVVDPTDSNKLKDLGDSLCVDGSGITYSETEVVKVDRTTGGWGWGVYTDYDHGSFNPGEIIFTDIGNGKPKWLNANAADGTVILLFNRFRTADAAGLDSIEYLQLTDSSNPMFGADASRIGLVKASEYTVASTGTTVLPLDTAFGIAMHARRSGSAFWKYFYGTQAGGTFTQEGSTGTIADAGGLTTINKLGTNAGGSIAAYELFAVIVCPTEFLSGADMNAILSDPIGTLINTGGAPVVSSPTPSGTLGTSTTATVGATTDTVSGTLFWVVGPDGAVGTPTGAQIEAGQYSGGGAAAFSGSEAIVDTSPDDAVTGLTANTIYDYALVQETSGYSNVLTGTFTTATATFIPLFLSTNNGRIFQA